MKIVAHGIPYEKRDGQCVAPGCEKAIDWSKEDKPLPGWATITMKRYARKDSDSQTYLLCPEHTITFSQRQLALGPKTRHLVRVIIESPYAGDVALNLKYVRAAMRDSILRGEAPFPSHALYTQQGVLDDLKPKERQMGMEAGFAWGEIAQKVVVYTDLGITSGMQEGILRAQQRGQVVEHRSIRKAWMEALQPQIERSADDRSLTTPQLVQEGASLTAPAPIVQEGSQLSRGVSSIATWVGGIGIFGATSGPSGLIGTDEDKGEDEWSDEDDENE